MKNIGIFKIKFQNQKKKGNLIIFYNVIFLWNRENFEEEVFKSLCESIERMKNAISN